MFKRFAFILQLSIGLSLVAKAQSTILTCQATVNPVIVRVEGLAERMGDILLQCSGGAPNTTITGNLTVFLSVPITNRTDGTGFTDLQLTVDSGSGFVPANTRAAYLNAAALSFSGLSFNLSPTGTAALRLSNLRGAANRAAGGLDTVRQITASLSFTGGSLVSFYNNVFSVATVLRSLYSSYTSPLICSQYGSAPIKGSSFANAITGRATFSTIRITEGFPSAFGPHSDFNFQTGDFGTRVILRFKGVPTGVRIWLPDSIVGTDGLQPTSAGDYGLDPSPGVYVPNSHTLLLLRVATNDAPGGGFGSGRLTGSADTISEATVGPDGIVQAVYEVFDANQFAVESATIPAFIYVPPGVVDSLTEIAQEVTLAPSSTTVETTSGAPIPRFVPSVPPNDCPLVGDCRAYYFPHMAVDTPSFDVSMTTQDKIKTTYFVISKSGTGNYIWNASVRYTGGITNGYPWLRVTPSTGLNRETPRVDIVPGSLPPGVYDAVIVVDAGPVAGSAQIPVTLRLSYQAPTPVVTSAVNPANMKAAAMVPGSTAVILGDRLSGSKISVTFDGVAARILNSASNTRLDVQVPEDLAGKSSSMLVVNVDGIASTPPLAVPIGISAPVIFSGSTLNSDYTSNNSQNGALAGTAVNVYVSGLPASGVFSGQIHDRIIDGENLVYAGPAPGIIGVEMMTMIVPLDLPSMTTGVIACGGPTADALTCSDSADLTIIAVPTDPPADPQPQ